MVLELHCPGDPQSWRCVLRSPRKAVYPHAGHHASTQAWIASRLPHGVGPQLLYGPTGCTTDGLLLPGEWCLESCVGDEDAGYNDADVEHLYRDVGNALSKLNSIAPSVGVQVRGVGTLTELINSAVEGKLCDTKRSTWAVGCKNTEPGDWATFLGADLLASASAAVAEFGISSEMALGIAELWGMGAAAAAARPVALVHGDVSAANIRVHAQVADHADRAADDGSVPPLTMPFAGRHGRRPARRLRASPRRRPALLLRGPQRQRPLDPASRPARGPKLT